jgi:hypothetical protein
MPIAPITGRLRKRLLLDLSSALGLGVAVGYAYWLVIAASMAVLRLIDFFFAGMVIISRLVSIEARSYG